MCSLAGISIGVEQAQLIYTHNKKIVQGVKFLAHAHNMTKLNPPYTGLSERIKIPLKTPTLPVEGLPEYEF